MSSNPTSAPNPDAMPTGTTQGAPQVLLAHHLKQLKLHTVLREYDKVAREDARARVDHPRYLLRLVELELIDRERRLVERRIRQARFPITLQPSIRGVDLGHGIGAVDRRAARPAHPPCPYPDDERRQLPACSIYCTAQACH